MVTLTLQKLFCSLIFVNFFTFFIKSKDLSLSFIIILVKNNFYTFVGRKTVIVMRIVNEEREKKKFVCNSPQRC